MEYDNNDFFYKENLLYEPSQYKESGLLGDFDLDLYDETVKMNSEIFQKAARRSIEHCYTRMEIERKEKNRSIKAKCSAIILALALTIGLGVKLGNKFENENVKNEAAYELGYIVNDNTHSTGYNGEYFYSHEAIATDILNYAGNRDMDSVIFTCYTNINYHVVEQMDIIFRIMKNYIDAEPEKYSDDVKKACYYSSFNEYLESHNFKDIDDYKKTMMQIMVAYKESQSTTRYDDLIDSLYEGESYGER